MIPEYLTAMANHVWQSTVLAVAAVLLVLALKQNRPAARYWLWAAASLKFLVPFALLINVGSWLNWRTGVPVTQREVVAAVQGISQPVDAGVWLSFSSST